MFQKKCIFARKKIEVEIIFTKIKIKNISKNSCTISRDSVPAENPVLSFTLQL